MHFSKYQGLGNDFIIVDQRQTDVVLTPERVCQLCDRRFGIGADGVLEVRQSNHAVAEMRVHNADGSIAEMCGNGLRCVARYLQKCEKALPASYRVDTGSGALRITHHREMVGVHMGPLTDHGHREVEVEERSLRGRFVSLGNPHFVLFGQWSEGDARRLGPQIEQHPEFPHGVNVSFATLRGSEIDLFVWERGCGLTLACGTGACATAATAWLEDHLGTANTVAVNLPGGQLKICGGPKALEMHGPATHVFDGEWRSPIRN